MDNNIVSIIIPIYNSEKLLKRCINSIVNQTYKNIEIILVNDGSDDSSGEICEDYARKDKRIKVIHQKNMGVSTARNRGVHESKGRYIQFVDSDDEISPTMTEILVKEVNNSIDLVICGYKNVILNNDGPIKKVNVPLINGILENNEFMVHFGDLYYNSLINSPCNKLYVSKIIKNNEIRFNELISNGEDLLFNLSYINFCRKISLVKKSPYLYQRTNNLNSLSKRYVDKYFDNRKFIHQEVTKFLIKKNANSQKNKEVLNKMFTNYIKRSFDNLFHKDSKMNYQTKKREIQKIVCDEWVRDNLQSFEKKSLPQFLIWLSIYFKQDMFIYFFFKFKSSIR